jgi:hypothetical protein
MRTNRLFLSAAIALGGVAFVTGARAQDANTDSNPNAAQRAADKTGNAAQNAADRTGNAAQSAGTHTSNAMQRAGDKVENAADKTGNALKRAGDKITGATTNPSDAMAPDADDIRKTLAQATEAALTKGGFDDMVERFSDTDRNRLGKDRKTEAKDDTLDGRIAQFQKDWKAKYNQDFKIPDRNAVYDQSFAMIRQGELPGLNNARMAGERQTGAANAPGTAGDLNSPSANTGATGTGAAANRPSGDNSVNTGNDRATKAANRANENMAAVVIAESHGMPSISIPMIHEFPDSWRVDVPDNYNAQQLRDNLLKHLTMADEQKDQWPSDPNEAYRNVTHHVFMAIMNVDEKGQLMDTRTNDANNNDRTPGAAKRSDNQ